MPNPALPSEASAAATGTHGGYNWRSIQNGVKLNNTGFARRVFVLLRDRFISAVREKIHTSSQHTRTWRVSLPTETELKLELMADAEERLLASGLLGEPTSRKELRSIYFDTPDYRLRKAG